MIRTLYKLMGPLYEPLYELLYKLLSKHIKLVLLWNMNLKGSFLHSSDCCAWIKSFILSKASLCASSNGKPEDASLARTQPLWASPMSFFVINFLVNRIEQSKVANGVYVSAFSESELDESELVDESELADIDSASSPTALLRRCFLPTKTWNMFKFKQQRLIRRRQANLQCNMFVLRLFVNWFKDLGPHRVWQHVQDVPKNACIGVSVKHNCATVFQKVWEAYTVTFQTGLWTCMLNNFAALSIDVSSGNKVNREVELRS